MKEKLGGRKEDEDNSGVSAPPIGKENKDHFSGAVSTCKEGSSDRGEPDLHSP